MPGIEVFGPGKRCSSRVLSTFSTTAFRCWKVSFRVSARAAERLDRVRHRTAPPLSGEDGLGGLGTGDNYGLLVEGGKDLADESGAHSGCVFDCDRGEFALACLADSGRSPAAAEDPLERWMDSGEESADAAQ